MFVCVPEKLLACRTKSIITLTTASWTFFLFQTVLSILFNCSENEVQLTEYGNTVKYLN